MNSSRIGGPGCPVRTMDLGPCPAPVRSFALFRSSALALLVIGVAHGCGGDAGEPLATKVEVRFTGNGDGLITVTSPDFPAFNWECTKTGGVVVDADTVTGSDGQVAPTNYCSRNYDRAQVEVLIYAEGRSSRFIAWSGASCTGAASPCRALSPSSPWSPIYVAARFDPTTATVALLVDGRSDAVTLLQGLSASAVATARGSSGQVLSGTTFNWSSSDPSTVSVSGSSTGNATVRGESPGTATITAAADGVTSNPVSVTVAAPQLAKGYLQGVLYDVDRTTPLDSVYLSAGPVQGSQGDALRGVTGRQSPLDPGGIPHGGYRFEATNGRYAMFSVAVLGKRYVTTPGDTADVLAGQTTPLDLFVSEGYHLDMLDTDLGTIQAAPGSTVNLVVSYRAWNRDLCPGCVPSLGIGVDSTALNVYRFGSPDIYPGKREDGVTIPITVPDHGGTIYATLITRSTAGGIEPGLALYRELWASNLQGTTMIPIGTLVVTAQSAPGVLRGRVLDGTTPLDSIQVIAEPIAGSTGTPGLRWQSGRQLPDAPGGIPAGGYLFDAEPGTYVAGVSGLDGSRWVSTSGDTTVVLAGDTTVADRDVRRGYHLDMLNTDLTVSAAPGGTVNVTLDFRVWNRIHCPGCVPSIAIGVEGEPVAVHRFDSPGAHPGQDYRDQAISFAAPSVGGTMYAVLVIASTATSLEPGFDEYRRLWGDPLKLRFVPIGTLTLN